MSSQSTYRYSPRNHSNLQLLLKPALGALASLCFATALASDPPLQVAVQYADLNLSSPSDAQLLYKRLRNASKNVCRDLESRDLSRKRLRDQCYEQALTGAVARVNHAALSALHAADGSIKMVQHRSASEPRS